MGEVREKWLMGRESFFAGIAIEGDLLSRFCR
jgi:hypothetical protein